MKALKTIKHIIFSFAFVLALGLMFAAGTEAKAATTTETKTEVHQPYITSVGSEYNAYGSNIKINNKAIKKSKKKVKALLNYKNNTGYYIPASYYDREYYATYADYKKAQQKTSYKVIYSYDFVFKKAGTYKFSWEEYACSTEWVDVPGQTYRVRNVKVTKTIHTQTVKVVKDTNILKYIKLGNAKYKNSMKNSESSHSSTTVVNKYLKGTSGKLKVKLNSSYAITSIIVQTYDGKGNVVYRQVANNSSVKFGDAPYDANWNSSEKVKNTINKELMKSTTVYIGYKNKLTGEYCKYTIKKNARGNSYIETEIKDYWNDQPYTYNWLTTGTYSLHYRFFKK